VSGGVDTALGIVLLAYALRELLPLGARIVAPGPSARGLARVGAFMTVHKRG
jgi:hypothetical protein